MPAHAFAIANGEVATLLSYDKGRNAAISICHEHLKRRSIYGINHGKSF
ncbi:hypothetical protein CES85_2153 [Ochrobactrum quorumnocens]|uniref:Uncharacterized protein n=1 Tax=Ochrobactrum quorumnocens TaxID=271865 RepID=A0A248UJD6_9HYPH|nr:hypothetical protein CES85_2153 [[Ochrobactrum] quorumnocens]